MFNDIVLQEKVFICKSQNSNVPTFLYYSQYFANFIRFFQVISLSLRKIHILNIACHID